MITLFLFKHAGHHGWLTQIELLLKLGAHPVQLIQEKSSGKATRRKVAQIVNMLWTTVMYAVYHAFLLALLHARMPFGSTFQMTYYFS